MKPTKRVTKRKPFYSFSDGLDMSAAHYKKSVGSRKTKRIGDREMLDWMQRKLNRSFLSVAFGIKVYRSLRSAIRAAMLAERK